MLATFLLLANQSGRDSALNGPAREEIMEAARASTAAREAAREAEEVAMHEKEMADLRRHRRLSRVAVPSAPEPPVRYARECPVCGAPVGQPCPTARLGKAGNRGETEHKERKHLVLGGRLVV